MKIVIVGGGFAGINLAQELLNSKSIEVILVDKNNYNFFPPLIYQVATAFLEPSSISYPFRKFFAGKKKLKFPLGELEEVNTHGNKKPLFVGGVQILFTKYDMPNNVASILVQGFHNYVSL